MIWQKIRKYLVSNKFLNYFLSNAYLPTAIYGKKARFRSKTKSIFALFFTFHLLQEQEL